MRLTRVSKGHACHGQACQESRRSSLPREQAPRFVVTAADTNLPGGSVTDDCLWRQHEGVFNRNLPSSTLGAVGFRLTCNPRHCMISTAMRWAASAVALCRSSTSRRSVGARLATARSPGTPPGCAAAAPPLLVAAAAAVHVCVGE